MAAASDGSVYVLGNNLTALSQAGVIKWSVDIAWNPQWVNPTVGPDGAVYVGNELGANKYELVAARADGTVKWTYSTAGLPLWSPTLGAGGTISVVSGDQPSGFTIETVSSAGERKWTYSMPTTYADWMTSGADGTLYVGAGSSPYGPSQFEGGVFAITSEGKEKWSLVYPFSNPQPPACAADGSLYLAFPYPSTSVASGGINIKGSRLVHAASTGKTEWVFYGGGPAAEVSIDATGTLYAACPEGVVQTVQADGTLGWQYVATSPVTNTPTLGADGSVYFGTADGTVYALTAAGVLKWAYKTPAPIYTAIALGSGGAVYATCFNGTLYALSLKGGLLWRYVTPGTIIRSSPAVATDGTIYFSSGGWNGTTPFVYALYPSGGLKWSTELIGEESAPAVGNDGTVYLGGDAAYAFTPNGTEKWQWQSPSEGAPLLPATGSDFYIDTVDFGELLNSNNYQIWTWPTSSTNPGQWGTGALTADGSIYVPSSGSGYPQLAALDAGGKLVWYLPSSDAGSFGVSVGLNGAVYMVSANGILYAIQ